MMAEMEPDSSEEEGSGSDFDVAADALASELGTTPTPGFRRALKEAVMACMNTDYESEEAPEEEDEGLALIFGGAGPKGK
jgi:hypothetical protein